MSTGHTLSPDAPLVPGSHERPMVCPACHRAFLRAVARRAEPCPRCGRAGPVSAPRLPSPAPPEGLVPFGLRREEVAERLRTYLAGRWLLVADLRVASLVERLVPVWLPMFWVDAVARGPFEAEVAFEYTVRSSVDQFSGGRWQSQKVDETRLRWEPRAGQIDRRVDNLRVEADSEARWFREHLGAWDLSGVVPADASAVDAAVLLLPDRTEDEAWPVAAAACAVAWSNEVQRAAGAVAVRGFCLREAPTEVHWSFLLLPAYTTWYADDDGVRHVLWIHGQHGAVHGPRLSSRRKWLVAAAVTLCTALGLAVVGMAAAVLFFWFPPVAIAGLILLLVSVVPALLGLVPLVVAFTTNQGEVSRVPGGGVDSAGVMGAREVDVARATWFCVDIECSGPVPGLYDMISLGAVPVTHGPSGPVLGSDLFYVEICPTAPRVDPGAMKVNGLDLERLRREGAPMAQALAALSAFVAKHRVPGTHVVFVGHNAPFDWSFVSYAYHAEAIENPFGYKALDTKALAMGVLGLHWLDTNKEVLEATLALPRPEPEKVHRADYDAWYQAHILVGLLRRMPDLGDPARR